MNSFETACDKLEANQIDAEGARAMRVCEHADAMLKALTDIVTAYTGRHDWHQERYIENARQIIAAIDPN
jgi:hypothetical protein